MHSAFYALTLLALLFATFVIRNLQLRVDRVLFSCVDLHLKCKAGFVESFEWGEIVESLSWSIVEPIRHVCKGVV